MACGFAWSSQSALVERKLAHPGFWMAVGLVLIILGVQIALSVPLGVIDLVCEQVLHRANPHLERQPFLIGCINLISFGAAIALGLYLNRLPFRRAFSIGQISLRLVGCVAVAVLGAGVLLSEADNALRALLPPPKWLWNLLNDMFVAQNKLLSQIFLLVVVAPVTEELVFRGIILRGLLGRYREAAAVTLTALLFAALHINPWQFLSALFLGIVFGWFYLRTGSVLLCVLAHAMANNLTIIFTLIPLDIPGMSVTPDYGDVVFQPWWLDLSGLGVLLAGLWAFRQATPPTPAAQQAVPPPLPPVITDQPTKPRPGADQANNSLPPPVPPPLS